MAKGKGELTTWFLKITGERASTVGDSTHDESSSLNTDKIGDLDLQHDDYGLGSANESVLNPNTMRLVDWNVGIVRKLIRQIIVRREAEGAALSGPAVASASYKPSAVPRDEVTEIIHLPPYDAKVKWRQRDPRSVRLSDAVEEQIKNFVMSSKCDDLDEMNESLQAEQQILTKALS